VNNITTIEQDGTAVPETATAPYKVDVSRGEARSDVSKQWASRPADQRYLSLDSLFEMTNRRKMAAVESEVASNHIIAVAAKDRPNEMVLALPGDQVFAPTHYSFGQMFSLAGIGACTPTARRAPAWLAADLLNNFMAGKTDPAKYYADRESRMLRALTGPAYGRIYDADLVASVRKFAGNGTGDTPWKVPGVINWGNGTYNPNVDITQDTTTLYASDRDVFIFLVDDTHPIEIGKLANGDPDLVFRGFYCFNSEVGSRSLGIATFFLRGVCQNRTLWGVENFQDIRIIHSRMSGDRFAREAEPALLRYANSSPDPLLSGIRAAKEAMVGFDDDKDRHKFLEKGGLGFSQETAKRILETFEREEQKRMESVWDVATGITAAARVLPFQDQRIEMEKVAASLLDRVTRGRDLVAA
jgi:hypothetical protein